MHLRTDDVDEARCILSIVRTGGLESREILRPAREGRCVEGLGDEEALGGIAAEVFQRLQGRLVLNALGYDGETEVVAQLDR